MSDNPVPFPVKIDAKLEASTAHIAKPLEKFFAAVAAGCGVVYEPWHQVRMARAKAKAAIIRANTTVELKAIEYAAISQQAVENGEEIPTHNTDLSLSTRAKQRVQAQAERRQANIDATVQKALEFLPNEVSDDPVDPDLMNRIFDGCQDVSDSDMQTYWSKLIAGEVAKPHSFSRKTVLLLEGMTSADAKLFEKICALTWEIGTGEAQFVPDLEDPYGQRSTLFEEYGLTYGEFMHASWLGLVQGIGSSFPFDGINLLRHGHNLLVATQLGQPVLHVNGYSITPAGFELGRLMPIRSNEKFFEDCCRHFWKCAISLSCPLFDESGEPLR